MAAVEGGSASEAAATEPLPGLGVPQLTPPSGAQGTQAAAAPSAGTGFRGWGLKVGQHWKREDALSSAVKLLAPVLWNCNLWSRCWCSKTEEEEYCLSCWVLHWTVQTHDNTVENTSLLSGHMLIGTPKPCPLALGTHHICECACGAHALCLSFRARSRECCSRKCSRRVTRATWAGLSSQRCCVRIHTLNLSSWPARPSLWWKSHRIALTETVHEHHRQ